MNDLELFRNSQFEARALLIGDEPWFVAADVARALGYSATEAMTRSLDDEEKGMQTLQTPGGEQQMVVISESGLYSAALRSRVAGAKAFKRWVTREVLPSIRRTGGYAVPEPRREISRRELAQMVIEAEDARAQAEARVAELEPAARAVEALVTADGDVTLREAAQILSRDTGVTLGQNRLSKYLKAVGWVSEDQRPYQRHVEAGRVTMVLVEWEHPVTGEMKVTPKTMITPKGLVQLHQMLTAGSDVVPA